jgi:hypothetical protein
MGERDKVESRLLTELDTARADYVRIQADFRKALDTLGDMAAADRMFAMQALVTARKAAFDKYKMALKRFNSFALHEPISGDAIPE